jgi:hypothetical protein
MKRLTAHQIEMLTKCIFVRFNFEGNFTILTGFSGETFLSLDDAQEHLRKHCNGVYWEISTFEQALLNNGMRDNL